MMRLSLLFFALGIAACSPPPRPTINLEQYREIQVVPALNPSSCPRPDPGPPADLQSDFVVNVADPMWLGWVSCYETVQSIIRQIRQAGMTPGG